MVAQSFALAVQKVARASLSERAVRGRKAEILRSAVEFTAVLRKGRSAGGRLFLVKAAESGYSGPRLGIIAAKKIAKRAVDRNRGKRLIREAFRSCQGELVATDLVVQMRSDLRGQDNAIIRAELVRLMKKVAGVAASIA